MTKFYNLFNSFNRKGVEKILVYNIFVCIINYILSEKAPYFKPKRNVFHPRDIREMLTERKIYNKSFWFSKLFRQFFSQSHDIHHKMGVVIV